MERVTRALERAYSQRESRFGVKAGASIAPQVVQMAPPAPDPLVDFTDTVTFRTPVIELDPQLREHTRMLPPGAGGTHGGAYKMLRTQVLRRMDQLGANTLGIVSAASGEGKTLTAINLAIAIAADAARTVLLVDFNLRNPSVHRSFRYEPPIGLEQCIEEGLPLREAMFKVEGYERLTVLPAKSRRESSSELLGSLRVADLVNEMRSRYANRIVIFDLPPVLETDDTLACARHLQAALLVIGAGTSRRDDVTRTLELLHDLPFVGTVLNGSREKNDTLY